MPENGSQERYLEIRMIDHGETWGVEVNREHLEPTDPDICDLLEYLLEVVKRMHTEAHVAQDLAERRN